MVLDIISWAATSSVIDPQFPTYWRMRFWKGRLFAFALYSKRFRHMRHSYVYSSSDIVHNDNCPDCCISLASEIRMLCFYFESLAPVSFENFPPSVVYHNDASSDNQLGCWRVCIFLVWTCSMGKTNV